MPSATIVTEKDVTVASATVPVRLDDPSTNPAPSGRYWVRVINPHATLRVFIGHSSTTGADKMNVTNCETVDPFNGVWEDSLGSAIGVYALSETGASIVVRVKQYA
jgi:hypothetical protein